MANNRYQSYNEDRYNSSPGDSSRERSHRSSAYQPNRGERTYEPNYQGYRNYEDDSSSRRANEFGERQSMGPDRDRSLYLGGYRSGSSQFENMHDSYDRDYERDFNRREQETRDRESLHYDQNRRGGDMRRNSMSRFNNNDNYIRDYGPYEENQDYRSFGSPARMSFESESSRGTMTNYSGRGPKGYKRSDERIREDVCECLERDSYVDASEIDVAVKEGVVTLSGSVEDRRTKRHAEDAIENISGVKDIKNELSVDQSLFQQAKELFTGESKSTSSKNSKSTSARH